MAGYSLQEPPLVRLLNNSILHFVPFTESFESILDQYSQNQSVCDPITREEFADRLLSPENDKKKSMFLSMLESNRFDLALTFSAGGFDIQSPQTNDLNSIFAKSALKMAESRLKGSHEECGLNSLRAHQTSTLRRITQFLLDTYQLPLYSLQVSCCEMPPQTEIGSVWRQTIHKTLNFLKLTQSGVKGSIRNSQSTPLRNAAVTVIENGLTKQVTKNMAIFRFILPAGQYELRINSTDTGIQTMPIIISDGQILDLGNILLEQRHSARYQLNNGQTAHADVKTIFGGKISGFILDEQNHPIKGAQITLVNSKKRVDCTTDNMGKFELAETPFGVVMLKVEAYGHESATRFVAILILFESLFLLTNVLPQQRSGSEPKATSEWAHFPFRN